MCKFFDIIICWLSCDLFTLGHSVSLMRKTLQCKSQISQLLAFVYIQFWCRVENWTLKADRADNKMCWLQYDIQPPSIGSLLSLTTLSHQRQTSSPQSQNREQVVPRQKRRTSKQTAGVCCFLNPPAEAQLLWSLLRTVRQSYSWTTATVGSWLEDFLSLVSLGKVWINVCS